MFIKIKKNSEINIKVDPLNLLIPNSVLNSLCKVIKILFHINEIREWKIQNIGGKNNIPNNVLNQFKDKFKIFVEGSKIENRFIIIIKLYN